MKKTIKSSLYYLVAIMLLTSIKVNAQKPFQAQYFGGAGGNHFEPGMIKSIAIRHGNKVDAIIINGIRHGGGGGNQTQTLMLDEDEYINKMVVRHGNSIDNLVVYTNKGRTIGGGGNGGTQTVFEGKIVKIGGRSGNRLDGLQVLGPYVPNPPFSEADLKPVEPVAKSYCDWQPNGLSPINLYQFENSNNLWGNFYEACVGYELWHPQHIVRLQNKTDENGIERAYFMVSQSRAHNGYIHLLETNPGVLDPATDQINASDNGTVGKIIWNDVYTGLYNGTINPIGNWSHPCKMDVCGGILVVAAQNWQSDNIFCNSGKKGDSRDAVLFYDVRDPQNPKYLSKITVDELRLQGGEISSIALMRAPNGDYILNVGGNSWATYYAKNKKIGWEKDDWVRVSDYPLTGQHGMNFMSSSCDGLKSEQMVFFDTKSMNKFSFTSYDYNATNHQFTHHDRQSFSVSAPGSRTLPGADRDWDADGLYISKFGVPIIYTVKSIGGKSVQIYQVTPK